MTTRDSALPATTSAASDVPPGLRLMFDPGLRRVKNGAVLIGGTPMRVMRLTTEGARLLDRWAAGTPVGVSRGEQRLARRLLDAGITHPERGASPYTTDDVSIVIPVRDRPHELARLCEALGPVGEVIIVDDGSTTALLGATARHRRPRGPAAAGNTGGLLATRDIVAFVDSDCEPTPGWLDRVLPHFADSQVVAVAPRVVSRPGRSRLARYESARSPLDLGPVPASVRPGTRIGYVPTAALVVRRSALEDCSGFDERLRLGEDVDLVWRLIGRGGIVRY